jgi:hypothetical protein
VKLNRVGQGFIGGIDPPRGGRDCWSAYARENADRSVDVFYDRLKCSNRNVADIYRIHDPHPGP